MANFLEELYYGNIDPQARGYRKGSYNLKVSKDINELVSEVTGMFAGGKLSDDALDGAMRALNEAYWIAKDKNKKYGRKKKKDAEEA